MANISTYTTDSAIDPADKVIGTDGTDGADNGKTKNFSIGDLQSYIGKGGQYLQKKLQVSNAQLKNNVNYQVFESVENNIIVPVSAVVYVEGQEANNKLNYAHDITITYKGSLAIGIDNEHLITIEKEKLNNTTAPADRYYQLYNTASEVQANNALVLKAGSTPTETGTSVTQLTIWLTYQIIDLS